VLFRSALAARDGARAAADDAARLAAAARDGLAALAPAEAGGLLWASGDRLVFRHPLVRSAAYSSATFAERRRAHTALAGALPGEADADRRAWHRAAALEAPDESVAEELERSAQRARLRGGHAAAAAALERSARLTAADALRARRLAGAAGASHLAGDAEHALKLAGEVLALSGDELIAAEAAGVRGAINAHRGASEDAEADLLRAARAVAESDSARALRFALAAGETALLGGRYERTAEIADWARTLADADAADFVAGLAHLYARRPAAAAPHFEAARERAEFFGDPQFLIWAGAGTFYGGDIDRARLTYMRAVAIARERGAVGQVAFGLPLVAMFELIEGRFTQARADASEGLRLAQECGEEGAAMHQRALLAWHAAVQGREDEARDLAAAALEWTVANTVPLVATTAHRALAVLDLGLGRHEAAFERLAAAFNAPTAHPVIRLLAVGDLAEAAARCDRAEEARPALAALAEWGGATKSAWAAAILAGAEPTEDSPAAHAAISLPFDAARLKLRLGEKLRRERRRVDARQYLRAALDDFAALGAAPWERRAAEELRATGETARKRDASTLDDLTPQELQIARLVGEGASNRDVAGRLFLSPRTVEYHLRKVFQKLGVTSRTQLAALDW